jgi:hypothetical protein
MSETDREIGERMTRNEELADWVRDECIPYCIAESRLARSHPELKKIRLDRAAMYREIEQALRDAGSQIGEAYINFCKEQNERANPEPPKPTPPDLDLDAEAQAIALITYTTTLKDVEFRSASERDLVVGAMAHAARAALQRRDEVKP